MLALRRSVVAVLGFRAFGTQSDQHALLGSLLRPDSTARGAFPPAYNHGAGLGRSGRDLQLCQSKMGKESELFRPILVDVPSWMTLTAVAGSAGLSLFDACNPHTPASRVASTAGQKRGREPITTSSAQRIARSTTVG
jgi:hypothetical protein